MDNVLSNARKLKSLNIRNCHTFASVVGGFSGLNFLSHSNLHPQNIVLFDINPFAVEYAQLFIELVLMSEGPADLIGRIFNRSVTAFEQENGTPLNCKNQEQYLSRPFEPGIWAGTRQHLSEQGRKLHQKYLAAFLRSHIHQDAKQVVQNCIRLLPCWHPSKHVPVTAGGSGRRSLADGGVCVPNTNTFYYGFGWLESPLAFHRVKHLFTSSTVRFCVLDVLSPVCHTHFDFSQANVLHISNIDDFFVTKWDRQSSSMRRATLKQGGEFTVVGAVSGVRLTSQFRDIKLPLYSRLT